MTYDEAVAYLLEIPKFAGKAGHDNLRQYLDRLGDLHLTVPSIHVAGTNGKGSVCAFLASILQCAGYQVGMFTSPHLVTINERFRIGNDRITDGEFLEVFQRVKTIVDQGMRYGQAHPNFFEFVFMMAACWYGDKRRNGELDYVIYETGLGGRLDATNVLNPCVTIITSIGLDHMQYLGDTIAQIAGEKAGIIKPGVPCIYLAAPEEARTVIEHRAEELSAPIFPVEPSQIIIEKYDKDWIDFTYQSMYDRTHTITDTDPNVYRIRNTALYQLENAALAIEAAYDLLSGGKPLADAHTVMEGWAGEGQSDEVRSNGVRTDEGQTNEGQCFDIRNAICQGLVTMHWSGRMEELAPRLYVDGAHNEPAIQAFCNTITRMYQDQSVILLFAVSSDKSYNKMIRILCERLDLREVIVTAIYGTRTTPVAEVAELFCTYVGIQSEQTDNRAVNQQPGNGSRTAADAVMTKITVIEDLRQAYEYARERLCQSENCRVFCVGSLYLVGSLMEFIKGIVR